MRIISVPDKKKWFLFNKVEFYVNKHKSLKSSKLYKENFEDIEKYCMFIGYPRSGHSIIGALIDAHPNAIIAHELDTLRYIEEGFDKNQIFYLLLINSKSFAKAGRTWDNYSYKVEKQWQGTFKKLKVIGDKKGGNSIKRIQSNPKLLQELYKTIDKLPIKFIHIIRNPYDNITTMAKKHFNNNLKNAIDEYFSLCETVKNIKKQIKKNDVIDMKHESFVLNPKSNLESICNFLGLDADVDYLKDCAKIVYNSPHKTRNDLKWTSNLINIVDNKIKEFEFLGGYSYDN